MSKEFVGLDIGSYSVKAVFFDAKEQLFTGFESELIPREPEPDAEPADEDATTQVREAPKPPEEADETTEDEPPAEPEFDFSLQPWASATSVIMARHSLQEPLWHVAMPHGRAMTTVVDVPFEEESKVQSILPNLMMDALPFNISELVFDFITQPKGAEGHQALVGFARRADVSKTLDELDELGINPARLPIQELALASVLISRGLAENEPAALLDIGHEYTNIVVVHQGRILLSRRFETAGHRITELLSERFKTPYADAERVKHEYAAVVDNPPNEQMRILSDTVKEALNPIARDIRRSLQALFAKERVAVETIYLCGGTSKIKNLDRFFADYLGVTVSPIRGFDREGPESVMAWGLAELFKPASARVALNLRKGEFAYRGRSSYLRRQMYIMAAAAAAVLVVVFIALFLEKLGHEAQRDAMRAQLQSQTKKVFGEPLTRKKDVQRRLAGDEAGAMSFVPRVSAYEIMHDVTVAISADTKIELRRFEVDVDRKLIQIMGETDDATAVDSIVSDLEKIECLKDIKKDKLKVKTDGRADFELQISTECS